MATIKKISEQDAKRIDLFKEFITSEAEAEKVRQALTEVFFDYSRLLIKGIPGGSSVVSEHAENGLFYLTCIIQLLEDHQLSA